jgi:4-amino-4-deoxy-L-arabinose transferase-like glycosyltransferase
VIPPPSSIPADQTSAQENQAGDSWTRDLLILIVLFGLLLGFRLGSYALANPDEGRYAEIPREMLASGDWVTPHLNGVNYFEKPPLMYWAVAACLNVFGQGEWPARAVPALFSLAGILLTYATARQIYGRRAGLAAAAVLGTSLLYFGLSRILILDMGVTVLMSATLFCFILGVRTDPGLRRRLLFYGLYASAALATLTKGLIGFMLTGAVMALWLLVFNQWKRLRPLHLPTGILIFLSIAAPWHILAAQHNETWIQRYFVYEHWLRFTSPVASRPGAWWYFIPIIIGGLFPWIGFLWPALREKLRGGWAARAQNADAWFFVTWTVFIFLFFSKSHSKLIPYILPVFPPLAVIIGAWLSNALEDTAKLRNGLRVFTSACAFLGLAVLAIIFDLGQKHVIRDASQALALRPAGCALAAILLVGGILAPWLANRRGARAALGGVIVTMVLFFGTLTFAAPYIQKPGTKELALYVKAHIQPGERVVHYHEFFHDFTFYLGGVVDVVNYKGELELEEDAAARASNRFIGDAAFRELWGQPGRVYAVVRRKDVATFRVDQPTGNRIGDKTARYHLLAETKDHCLFSNQP